MEIRRPSAHTGQGSGSIERVRKRTVPRRGDMPEPPQFATPGEDSSTTSSFASTRADVQAAERRRRRSVSAGRTAPGDVLLACQERRVAAPRW